MSIKDKFLSYMKASPSMPWLTEVECLQNDYDASSDSVPYIDTGVIHSWDVPSEITATIAKTTSNRSIIISCYPGTRIFSLETTATNRLRLYLSGATSADPTYETVDELTPEGYEIPLNTPTKVWVRFNPVGDAAHTVNYEMGLETLDGEVKTTVSGSFYRDGQPSSIRTLRMFYDYRAAATAFNGGMKIYQLELKDGAKYHKYIPCLDLNRIPCMYDNVENKLYYNTGTGGFNAGRRIVEVEWLHLTGTQYFNTGLKPNTLTTTLKAKLIFEGTAMMMGCRNTSNYSDMCSIYMPNASSSYPYSRVRLDWMTGGSGYYATNITSEIVELEITGNYAKINGVEYTASTKTSLDMLDGFYIGCAYTSNASSPYSYPQTGKVYYVSLLNTTTRELYRYCVPAHDENNVGFFFDRVNHFIIDNKGTNTDNLTWGDEIHPVSYLYGGYPDRFDIGIPFYNHFWEIDIRYNINRPKRCFMGSGTGNCNYWGCHASSQADGYTYTIYQNELSGSLKIDPSETRTAFLKTGSNDDGTADILKMNVEGESVSREDTTGVDTTTSYKLTSFSSSYNEPAYLYGNRGYDRQTHKLIQNLIPVQNEKKQSNLLDTFTHTLIPNSNINDTFEKGADVIGYQIEPQLPYGLVEVDYLESTGTQYIDTGIQLKSSYGVEIEAKQTSATTGKSRYLFGDATTTNRYMLAVASGTDSYILDLESNSYRLDTSFSSYDGKFHTHKIENKTYYIDGVSQGTSTSTGTFTTSQNAFLFSAADALRTYCYWQIRKCKIFNETGRIIADYVPCLRIYDNKPGMFDLISRQFLTNQGTGEFAVGINGVSYTPADYLESTAQQYIDTGLKIDDTCGFYVDAQKTDNIDAIVLGVKGYSNSRWAYNPSSTNMNLSWNSIYTATTGGNTARHKVKVNVFNDRQRVYDLSVKNPITETLNKNASTYNVCLFGAKWGSETVILLSSCKIYSAFITKMSDVIAWYLPMVRLSDSKPGMIDIITQSFLTNGGSGTDFTVGVR